MKTIFQASSTNLQIAHILLRVIFLIGLLNVKFNLEYLIITFIWYHIFMTIGLSIMLHRYFSHHSFQFKSRTVEFIFTIISILAIRGSPLAWAYIHRSHHEYVDTEYDPHTPHGRKFRFFGLLDRDKKADDLKVWRIRSMMTKRNLIINQYYWLIVLGCVVPLSLLNFELFFFAWLFPVVLVQLSINFQNYLGHVPAPFSYVNFQTKGSGHSQNNILLWPLYLGEAWHNNHHSHHQHYHYGKEISGKWWEYDPGGALIKIIKR